MFSRRKLGLILIACIVIPAFFSPVRAQSTDTITIGTTGLPDSLDPADAYGFGAWEVLSHLYVGLTRQVPGTTSVDLALATDVQISEDRLDYTFTLRPDAAFSDGTPISAQTFVDSITRVMDLNRDAAQVVKPYVDRVEATPAGELVFHLIQPVPYFLQLLALPPYFPQHPTLIAAEQQQPFAENGLIGNGPYLLDHFLVNREIGLIANPDYTLGDAPLTPNILLRQYARSQDLRDALRNHEVDLAWRALLLDHLLELQTESDLVITDTPSTRVFYLYMSQSREPTDDPLVREAITQLIDRQPVIDKIFYGHASPLNSLIPASLLDADSAIWPTAPDVTLAEDLLNTAGYKDRTGRRVEFTFTFALPVYGETQDLAMRQLGRDSFGDTRFIDYGYYSEIERGAAEDMINNGDATVAAFGWTPVVPHPYAYLYPLFHSSQAMPDNSRYARPEIDAALERIAQIDDADEQTMLYQDIVYWALEDYALIPLWQDHVQVMSWSDIGGILVESNFFLHYDRLVRE
ncbi:MAG: hypothetical protein HY866_10250 [Chloroflexi bacterium]|nr:hypothetical protein [Chloroflexota bacterium]